tara:strand:+ start:1249 stop:2145 length:897 start_codon:yes stop_codon:yes gene_type:complete
MNFTKLCTVLDYKTTHIHIYIWAITISIFLTSCGGGPVPWYLKDAKVDISKWTPTKEDVLKKDNINLVKAIVPFKDSSEFLIVGATQVYKLSFDGTGKTKVTDDADNNIVEMQKKDQARLYQRFRLKDSTARIIASADFTGDGDHEILAGLAETDFAVLDSKAQLLSKLSVSPSYWYRPVVTASTQPFVVLSAGNVLDVYNSNLKFLKKFDAVGMSSPMHVVAATFIGGGPDAMFAAVYNGRGGWHRSVLYVFSSTGDLVYKEILDDDYQSICEIQRADKMEFLLGGRNEVLLYSFQQ